MSVGEKQRLAIAWALLREPRLLIAHRLSTIMQADTIFVLEKGRIIEKRTHSDLVEQKGLYYAMWRQQIGERPEIIPALLCLND